MGSSKAYFKIRRHPDRVGQPIWPLGGVALALIPVCCPSQTDLLEVGIREIPLCVYPPTLEPKSVQAHNKHLINTSCNDYNYSNTVPDTVLEAQKQ